MSQNHRRQSREVELNLAAMLDMAFQLLAFFILTFQPSPNEGAVKLRLPQAMPPDNIRSIATPIGATNGSLESVSLKTLTINVIADPQSGEITSLGIGDTEITGLPALERRMHELFADPGNPFEQVLLQVSDNCRYDELMRVVETCVKQRLPGSRELPKLAMVEIPGG